MAASGKTPPTSDKDKKAINDAKNNPNLTPEEKAKIANGGKDPENNDDPLGLNDDKKDDPNDPDGKKDDPNDPDGKKDDPNDPDAKKDDPNDPDAKKDDPSDPNGKKDDPSNPNGKKDGKKKKDDKKKSNINNLIIFQNNIFSKIFNINNF